MQYSKARNEEAIQVVKDAIDLGYRHIDTAAVYENEKDVGIAIEAKLQEGVITREDIFVTSKLWCTTTRRDLVIPALKKTLSDLKLEYLDLYLMHWPMSFKEGTGSFIPQDPDGKVLSIDRDYVDTWKELEKCAELGLTKSIGVANFNTQQLSRVIKNATIKPVINQIECHPFLNQKHLITFCKENGILITAFSPLANPGKQVVAGKPKLIDHPLLKEIGTKYNKTNAQIALRYLIQLGVNPIPKSSNKLRLAENINIFDFELNDEDMKLFMLIFSELRRSIGAYHYPFADEL
ncbi:1,5-anhydro-D-fructose reductase [Gryllus bimaculatus]|nr:1,5-anhydro-D-fructose reductase [Gryllus bimaculatus]